MVTLIFLETLEILCQGSMAFSVEDFYHFGEGGVNVELFFFGMSLNVCNIKHFVCSLFTILPTHPTFINTNKWLLHVQIYIWMSGFDLLSFSSQKSTGQLIILCILTSTWVYIYIYILAEKSPFNVRVKEIIVPNSNQRAKIYFIIKQNI